MVRALALIPEIGGGWSGVSFIDPSGCGRVPIMLCSATRFQTSEAGIGRNPDTMRLWGKHDLGASA